MATERSAGGPESIAEAAELLAGAKVTSLALAYLYHFSDHSIFRTLSLSLVVVLSWEEVSML